MENKMDADLARTKQRCDLSDDRSPNSVGNPRSGSKSSFIVSNDSSDSLSSLRTTVKSVRSACDSLLQQDVVIFQLSILHIDFCEAVAGQSWKLKCRMNGKTFWKSDAQKAEKCAGDRSQRNTIRGNATAKIVYECGDAIELELCSPSFFGSTVVAKSAISVSEALRSRHQRLDLGLTSAHDASGKVVAHLHVDFKVTCAPLASIGVSSLRENPVPNVPTFRKEFLAREVQSVSAAKFTECEKFVAEAEYARKSLQSAVELHRSLQLNDRPQ
jgi:hypothetical protein